MGVGGGVEISMSSTGEVQVKNKYSPWKQQ